MPPRGYSLMKAQDGTSIIDVISPRGYVESSPAGQRIFEKFPTNPTGAQESVSGEDAGLEDILSLFGLTGADGSVGNSSGQSSSWSAQPVLPPVLDLLAEMRSRRDSEAARAKLISDILSSNVPQGQNYYMGFEPGGVADVLLGIITGNGPGAASAILPEDQRRVRRQNVPIPGAEPEVGAEAGAASTIAQQIMDAIRVISTGGSQSSQGSTSGSAPAPATTPKIAPPSTGSGGNERGWM